ncbi:MAG: hypothetical protein QN178_00970 [Armatimonadota bacterium]|nr:hypothetical protein [Armatimonadota bacterium]
MVIMVDLDGVLCTEEKTFERSLARPLPGAAEALRALRGQGHTVVIHTARAWSEHRMTVEWLAMHGFECDGLVMGKPVCDVVVDDRAVRFAGWPATLQAIARLAGPPSPDVKYPGDEDVLGENRRVVFEFLHWLADQDLPEPILEVGPMVDGRYDTTSVLSRFPQYYVDSRRLFQSRGKQYLSLDIDPAVQPDIVGDVSSLDRLVAPGSLGTLIMLSVLEHLPRVWEVPDRAARALRPGGWLCLQTPWNLRFHGPRPDCWRISDDGYHALFDAQFEFVRFERVETPGRDLMPVCFTAVLRKR